VGAKAKDIDRYNLRYTGLNRVKNGVDILVGKDLVEQVVEVRHRNDRMMSIKLVVGSEIFNIVSAYAPQIRLDKDINRLLWEDLDEFIQTIT